MREVNRSDLHELVKITLRTCIRGKAIGLSVRPSLLLSAQKWPNLEFWTPGWVPMVIKLSKTAKKTGLAWLEIERHWLQELQMVDFVLITPINHTYSWPRAFCPCAHVLVLFVLIHEWPFFIGGSLKVKLLVTIYVMDLRRERKHSLKVREHPQVELERIDTAIMVHRVWPLVTSSYYSITCTHLCSLVITRLTYVHTVNMYYQSPACGCTGGDWQYIQRCANG